MTRYIYQHFLPPNPKARHGRGTDGKVWTGPFPYVLEGSDGPQLKVHTLRIPLPRSCRPSPDGQRSSPRTTTTYHVPAPTTTSTPVTRRDFSLFLPSFLPFFFLLSLFSLSTFDSFNLPLSTLDFFSHLRIPRSLPCFYPSTPFATGTSLSHLRGI